MCTAFKELFKDEILEAERNGEHQGQEKLGSLIAKLIQAGRTEAPFSPPDGNMPCLQEHAYDEKKRELSHDEYA